MKVIKFIGKAILSIMLIVILAIGGFFGYFLVMKHKDAGQYISESYSVDDKDKVKILLDCDNSMGSFWEVDDGLVLSYLLNKPQADLLGVTTTFGNRTYKHKYTEEMLIQSGRTDVPLYQGEQTSEDDITDAAIFLAETVAKYPGEVTVIAAGPVGNLEAAYQYDKEFFNNVQQITVMGGYTEDLSLGSKKIDELNLSADYKASYAMINSGAKVTIMTGQACLDAPFYFKDLTKLSNFPTNWKFFCIFWTCLQKLGLGNNYFVLWDLLPTIYVFHPEYFEDNFVYINSTPEDLSEGMLVISQDGAGSMVNIPDGIADKDGFYSDLLTTLNRQGK
jgi:purine nucleosidase